MKPDRETIFERQRYSVKSIALLIKAACEESGLEWTADDNRRFRIWFYDNHGDWFVSKEDQQLFFHGISRHDCIRVLADLAHKVDIYRRGTISPLLAAGGSFSTVRRIASATKWLSDLWSVEFTEDELLQGISSGLGFCGISDDYEERFMDGPL